MFRFFITHRHMGWRLGTAALGLAFLGLAFGPAQAQPKGDKLDKMVRQARGDYGRGAPRVIITVAPGARKGIYAKLKAHGATVNADFTIIEALAAELPPGFIRSLEQDKDVVSLSYDSPVGATLYAATETALRTTLALPNSGYNGTTGAGVGVAVIDSGIAVSADLASSRITAFRDFTTGPGAVTASPVDGYGHGTHVAS